MSGAFQFIEISKISVGNKNGTHVYPAIHWKISDIPGNKWNFEKLALFLVGNLSYKKCVPVTGFHELSQSLIWAAILNLWTEKGTNATRRLSRDGHFHQDVQKRLVNGKHPLI